MHSSAEEHKQQKNAVFLFFCLFVLAGDEAEAAVRDHTSLVFHVGVNPEVTVDPLHLTGDVTGEGESSVKLDLKLNALNALS